MLFQHFPPELLIGLRSSESAISNQFIDKLTREKLMQMRAARLK